MVIKTDEAMTGERYIESLRDGRELWIDGKRVGDMTEHPAFRDMVQTLAHFYDVRNSDEYRDQMTYVDPDTGKRHSLSWLVPRSPEDLKRKRRNSELWNDLTWGQLGRSPDLIAAQTVGMVQRRDELSTVQNPHCDFGENALNFYKHCLENDSFLTHALVDPQVDRSAQPISGGRDIPEDEVALHVVRETDEGVVVRGGKQLATGAPFSTEVYISLSPVYAQRNDERFVLSFAIPTGTPGLKLIAREPLSIWPGSWGHPFHSLDEQDCILVFDDLLVPWDRMFILYSNPAAQSRLARAGGGNMINYGWADLCRIHSRMKLTTAVATLVAQSIGIFEYREVAAKIGEMASYCELWQSAMDGVEHNAFELTDGTWSLGPSRSMAIWFSSISGHMSELLRQICASGIIFQPSESDLANPELRPTLEQYMRGKDVDVEYKSRLFRIAHDLAAGSFGMRQDIYEFWHTGDPVRNQVTLMRSFSQKDMLDRIKDLCSRPLPHCEQL